MIQSIGLLAFSIISTTTAYNPLDLYGITEAAAPSPVADGAQILRNVSIDLFKRADSRDPNCPDGYQCNLNTPCDDSLCSSDRFCVAFDGRNVCILRDQDSTWCRVNLGAGTLEGCNGAGRECCHGRCLSPGNKCCTFAGVKCEASDTSCQQCGPESTCGTGSCISSSSSSSSSSSTTTGATASNPTTIPSATSTGTATVSATTAQPPTTSVPISESTTTSTMPVPISESTATSTTTGASTTNGASTTTTVGSGPSTTTTTGTTLIGSTDISSSSSTSSSSSIAPTPTIAPQVDAFTFGGCFVDSSDARILVADSTEDGSSDGMTIEKCVAFADDGAWRYAGVEFGSQCYVGNTMHGQDQYPDSDCKTPCAGNPAEICGDGGRIQIYEDPTWSDPTAEELADAVRQYASAVDDVRSAMVNYRASLSDLADYVSSKTKRLLLKTGPEIEADLLKHESVLKAARAKLRTTRATSDKVFLKGKQRDTPSSNNPTVTEPIASQWDFTKLEAQINEAIDLCTQNAEAVQIAIDQDIAPQVDTALSIAQADAMIKLIGLGLVSAVVGTFFWALGELLSYFGGGSSSPEPGTTVVMPTTTLPTSSTTTATTTTTTTTCTETAATTAVGILAKQGISLADFSELVAGLPQDSGSVQLTAPWQPNYLYIGNIDQCTADQLDTNPLVARWDYASGSQPVFVLNENGIPECKL